MIIRSEYATECGYTRTSGDKVLTIFSVPNYCKNFNNQGAYVTLSTNSDLKINQIAN